MGEKNVKVITIVKLLNNGWLMISISGEKNKITKGIIIWPNLAHSLTNAYIYSSAENAEDAQGSEA